MADSELPVDAVGNLDQTGGNGFGTEVGIDRGVYPQARTFTFGVNVNF